MKVMAEVTTEIYDRYGRYGEAGAIVNGTLTAKAEEGRILVVTTLPDGREIIEYDGNDEFEASAIFEGIAASRVPDFLGK